MLTLKIATESKILEKEFKSIPTLNVAVNELIKLTLKATNGNVAKTARILNITRQTIYSRMSGAKVNLFCNSDKEIITSCPSENALNSVAVK
jgi:DNA-binding NtrC family response regulator